MSLYRITHGHFSERYRLIFHEAVKTKLQLYDSSFQHIKRLSGVFLPIGTRRFVHSRAVNQAGTLIHPNNSSGQGIEMSSPDESLEGEKILPLSKMPGPGGLKRLPYLGALFLFWPFSHYTPETYGQLVMKLHEEYGPVFKTRLGEGYTVHTSKLEDMEKIFDGDGRFPQRRLMTLSRTYRERKGLPQALGCVNGQEWHTLRKPLNMLLNRPQAPLHYLPAQNEVAKDFVQSLKHLDADVSAQEIYELFFKFSAESIGVVCFNARLGFLSADLQMNPEKQRLLDAFHTSLNCTFKAIIGLERRFLFTDKDPFYRKYAAAMDFIREQSSSYVQKVMDRLKGHSESPQKDNSVPVDVASEEECSNLLASLIQKSDLNMEQILAIIDSLLIAGSDSTARNLSVLLYNLAKHPKVQNRAAREVQTILGPDGPVTAQALGKMNYLKACVKESMRLFFPIPTGPERILSNDTIISGYLVPGGTSVIISNNKTSLDPEIYPDPLAYKPERWLRTETTSGQETDMCPQNTETQQKGTKVDDNAKQSLRGDMRSRLLSFAFLPFGHGPRSCIGRRFAELELYVCAARLLQKLEVEVDPSYQELKTIYTPFITPVEPIPFRFKNRQ